MPKVKSTPTAETPEAIRVEAGYATKAEVIATRVVSGPTLDKVEDGEPGVNTGVLDDLADLCGVTPARMYAAYAHARSLFEARNGAA